MALDVGGLDDAIVLAKLAFGTRIEQRHVFKWTAMDQDSGLTSDRAALWLNRVDSKSNVIFFILYLKLLALSLLLFSEGKDGHVVWIDLARLRLFSGFSYRWRIWNYLS